MLYNSIQICGMDVLFHTYREQVEVFEYALKVFEKNISIGYANPNTIVLSSDDPSYKRHLTNISFIFADGIGIHIAGRILKPNAIPYDGTQNATEYNYKILEYADQNAKKLYIVGGVQVSLERFVENIHRRFPKIIVVGVCNGYSDIDSPECINEINLSKPDLLFVGLGQPRQELWYSSHQEQLDVPVTVMVGGFIDFFSGYKKRAPKILQSLGLEWFFRLLQEPRRLWKRYLLGIPKFIFIVLKQKFTQ